MLSIVIIPGQYITNYPWFPPGRISFGYHFLRCFYCARTLYNNVYDEKIIEK